MRIIGDVHGHFSRYIEKTKDYQGKTFQVGDMGIGFPDGQTLHERPANHVFIRGNHDNPAECKKHPNYAGDFGYWKEEKLFFMGGAYSIDINYRLNYEKIHNKKIWWINEELYQEDLDRAFRLYKLRDPKVVITHDCPETIGKIMLEKTVIGKADKIGTRTGQMLEKMFAYHQPEIWIFGHWHFDFDSVINGTRFICLAELNYIDLEI